MKRLRAFLYVPLALLLVAFQSATDVVCNQVVEAALERSQTICAGLGRNQACYGNPLLEAEPQVGFNNFNFDEIGDMIDITGLQSLRLSSMNIDEQLWGVALMRLQANIPHQFVSRNVTLVLFGDVEVRNRVRAPILVAVRPEGSAFVNVRRYPDRTAFVLGTIQPTEIAIADGRLEGGNWYHVQLLETGESGWVSADTVVPIGDPSALNIVDIQSAEFGPMQAFFLDTGAPEAHCGETPQNGLLIQTPDGVATVDVWINEVKIRLGSTAFIQASAGEDMTVRLVEGATEVQALGVDQFAVAGTQLTVPMTEQLQPAAPPSLPEAYTAESVAAIPVAVLDRPIAVAPPLDQGSVESLNQLNMADAETPTAAPPTPSNTPPPPPTQTPRPTNTAVPTATATPLPTSTPLPTNTLLPTNTNTPLPSNTPVPTDTPHPPTDTPVPPTDTLVPPTDTPDPPPGG